MQDTGGRRLYTILVSFGLAALVVFIILAADTFGGDPAPLVTPRREGVASGYLIAGGVVIMLWCASMFYRCTDSLTKRNYVLICSLLLLWTLGAIVCESSVDGTFVRYLRYLNSVPLAFIPPFVLSNVFHLSSLSYRKATRVVLWVTVAISIVLVVLAVTNDLHGWYFPVNNPNPTPSAFNATPLQIAMFTWSSVVLLAAMLTMLAASRWRLRFVLSMVALLLVMAILVVVVYLFDMRPVVDSNLSIVYAAFIILSTEVCFQCGMIGSFSGFSTLFEKLPFDLKLLASDRDLLFRTKYKTDVAAPLLAEEKELLVKLDPQRNAHLEFRIPSVQNRMYRAYTIPGGIVLLSADSTVVSEETNRLEERQEMLKQQVAVLEQRNQVQKRLQRQKRERELFEDIEASLRSATTTIQTLVDNLPDADSLENLERRRQQLMLVKLIVAYCKRKGSLVLAQKGGVDFDRDRLMVIINEWVTDLRTAGADCAAIVEVDKPLSSYAVNQLYDCLYDFVTMAFQHTGPLIMVFIRTSEDDTVNLRAQLEDNQGIDQMQITLSEHLVERLCSSGIDHEFEHDEDSMRLNVTLPVGEGGGGGV